MLTCCVGASETGVPLAHGRNTNKRMAQHRGGRPHRYALQGSYCCRSAPLPPLNAVVLPSPPYPPACRHSRSYLLQQRASSPTDAQLAEMSLAELIAHEERACAGEQQHQQQQGDQQQQQQQGPGDSLQGGAHAVGASEKKGAMGAEGRGGGAAGAGGGAGHGHGYVDRAVLLRGPSPPGQMAGHRG